MFQGFTAAELLDVWERARHRARSDQALALLGMAAPELSAATLEQLPLGERDRRLLELRARTFGSELTALVECPACAQALELSLDAADVGLASAPPPEAVEVEADGVRVRVRLVNTADLVAVQSAPDVDSARKSLLKRCVLSVVGADEPLPESVVRAVSDAMAAADPLARIELGVECFACGHAWTAEFDVVPFFWSEIDAWAQRTLAEVHALASRYGWREGEILALSPARRQAYLEQAVP